MNVKKQFFEGLITQNPALVQLLGMCPLLAITTSMLRYRHGCSSYHHPDLLQRGYLRSA